MNLNDLSLYDFYRGTVGISFYNGTFVFQTEVFLYQLDTLHHGKLLSKVMKNPWNLWLVFPQRWFMFSIPFLF